MSSIPVLPGIFETIVNFSCKFSGWTAIFYFYSSFGIYKHKFTASLWMLELFLNINWINSGVVQFVYITNVIGDATAAFAFCQAFRLGYQQSVINHVNYYIQKICMLYFMYLSYCISRLVLYLLKWLFSILPTIWCREVNSCIFCDIFNRIVKYINRVS